MKKPNHRRRPLLRARSERPSGGRASNNFYEITPAHATIRPQSETLDNASCAKSITDWGAGVRLHVRFGSKADIRAATSDVCCDHESGHVPMVMSALPPKTDMCGAIWDVRFGPEADI